MIRRLTSLLAIALILLGCSGGKISYYEKGDLHTRQFLNHLGAEPSARHSYFEVRRNDKGQITTAKHYSSGKQLIEKSSYNYSRKGALVTHHSTQYFESGSPRVSREWFYEGGRISKREEKWFTRSHTLEKKMTIHYDVNQKVYLEETWGLARKIKNSTEYYYDYKNRLDKSRRNFFLPTGELRDYWLTIYNDEKQIVTEEHYLPDNSLIAFYRYGYHPVKAFRETEEIFDESNGLFVTRKYDEYGHLLSEIEKTRKLEVIKRTEYEYNEKHQPTFMHIYDKGGRLIKTKKYTTSRILERFRTPGS